MKTHNQILAYGYIELPNGFFDGHLHLRSDDDGRMPFVLPASLAQAWGAIIMPNTETPHIMKAENAREYREKIHGYIPKDTYFEDHLTLYLTDETSPEDVEEGYKEGLWVAAKLYPANATTGSAQGVTSVEKIAPVLFMMQSIGMPLLLHGEVVDENTDPLDMEKRYIDEVLVNYLLKNFPVLNIVMEHITTKEAAELVGSDIHPNLWATITPHHLILTHKHIFQDGKVGKKTFRRGLFPDRFCLPILKTNPHREALWKLIRSGSIKIRAGSDSAPHFSKNKYKCCGAAGCFVAPIAVQMYAHAFEMAEALHNLPGFLGVNMLQEVYHIPPSEKKPLYLKRGTCVPDILHTRAPGIATLDIGEPLNWELVP
jgi:dihydroorotase